MSIDDYYYDQGYDEWLDSLYRDFAKEVLAGNYDLYDEVISRFTSDRLQSYYVANPKIAERALWALDKAKGFLRSDADAALVFAVTAAEVGLKSCLLKPILHGLVHDEAMAVVITELMPEQRNDKFQNLLFKILKQYGGFDLRTYKRSGVNITLWEEMQEIQKLRNSVVHRAEIINLDDAKKAAIIASLVVEELFPSVIAKLGLGTNDRMEVSIKRR